jgi:hypothetical protein
MTKQATQNLAKVTEHLEDELKDYWSMYKSYRAQALRQGITAEEEASCAQAEREALLIWRVLVDTWRIAKGPGFEKAYPREVEA